MDKIIYLFLDRVMMVRAVMSKPQGRSFGYGRPFYRVSIVYKLYNIVIAHLYNKLYSGYSVKTKI